MIDCSLEAQAERRRDLARLRARLHSGVQSVSDRSRSVTYANTDALLKAIARLESEIAFCGGAPRARRLSYIPLVKAL